MAEALGTGFLVAAVVGSGIMAERLAGGNVAVALLANALATGAALVALILALGPVSGAHLNPAVTLVSALTWREAYAYIAAQLAGGIAGVLAANAMFALPLVSLSGHARSGLPMLLSEVIATFGLVATIDACSRKTRDATAYAVAAYITAAYWFTASTSFANPAVTVARAFSDSFAGIRFVDVPAFVVAQLLGAMAARRLMLWLMPR
jgi:glycerol uptake facilitator-like aquaporin